MIRQVLADCEAEIPVLAARLMALHNAREYFTAELQWFIDHPGEKSPWEITPPAREQSEGVK